MSDSTPSPPPPGEQRRLAAIVFTDVVGYSARMQRDETGTMKLVAADFALMRERCTQHGGELLNSMGDGLLLCFGSAVQAVACALQIQAEFAARRAKLPPEEALEHRMGVHIGDVFRQETGGVAGDGVNIAARLEGKAPIGGVCISQTVHDTVKGKVPMQAIFIGPESFKNITEPIPIWHIAAGSAPTLSRPPMPVAESKRRSLSLVVGAVTAGLIAAVVLWAPWKKSSPVVSAPPATASAPAAPKTVEKPRGIAVLAFENLDAADQAYFAAGITEEVTQYLAKIKTLRVMSRQAVSRFKGGAADLPAMTRELSIGAVLTGSVRRAGNQVRIAVQLLAAPSGETLWSEQYEREAKDIFVLQTEVAIRVANSLQASLAPEERARIERPPTGNPVAYELFLKARSKPVLERIEMLKQAISLDPKFELAYSVLSRIYLDRSHATGRDDLNLALDAARTAVAIDPQSARAQWALAIVLAGLGKMDEGRLAMQRAIELNPSFSTALLDLSVLEANAGRLDQALYWAKRAFPLAPNLAYSWYHIAGPLMLLDEASSERWLRAGIARFPADDPTGVYRLEILVATLDYYHGQTAAANSRLRKLVAAQPGNPECQSALTEFAFMTGAADAGDRVDQALKAGPGAHNPNLTYTPRTMRAFLWIESGDRAKALPLIAAALEESRLAIEAGDRSSVPHFENVALHLMRGDRAAALDSLEAAVTAGFNDVSWIKSNRVLAPLANEPRYLQLIERINRGLREMRSRVDLSDLDELAGIRGDATHK